MGAQEETCFPVSVMEPLAREASPVCCLHQVDEDTFGGFYEAFVVCCVEFSKFQIDYLLLRVSGLLM